MGVKVGDRVTVTADYLAGWTRGGQPVPEGIDQVGEVVKEFEPGSDYHGYLRVSFDVGGRAVRYLIPEGSLRTSDPLGDAVEHMHQSNAHKQAAIDALGRCADNNG